ncbi:MAG: MFS transporter [Burkholderiales bacterium]|nr:MFS transporter [Burkholderiales bacterium]
MRLTGTQVAAIVAGGAIFALVFGARQSLALFVGNINSATGLGLAAVSLAFAWAQLMWGVTQPLAGALADKFGAARVIAAGAVLVCIGTLVTPYARSTPMLILAVGVVAAGGAGMAGLGVLMSAVAHRLPVERRGLASGLVNAGGSFGQFAVVPAAQALAGAVGWIGAVSGLALVALAAAPLAWLLRGKPAAAPAGGSGTLSAALAAAGRDRNYLMLGAGFFVCGFHVAFIGVHLPGVVASCMLPAEVGAWSLSMVGLFNILGSFAAGWAIGRWRMKSVLAGLYASRAIAVIVFLAMPKTATTVLVFSAVIGFTYLATVPPTIGLVGKLHGLRYLATLFGVIMLVHQVGGFVGAWLGGRVFEATGSYDWVWYVDIVLATGAAIIHLPIREAHPAPRPVAA